MALSIAGLRQFNSREVSGVFGRSRQRLEALVLEHIETSRALAAMKPIEQTYCRLAAEGFGVEQIAYRLRISARTLYRVRNQLMRRIGGL